MNAALDSELVAARERLLRRFGEITLAALASDFEHCWHASSKSGLHGPEKRNASTREAFL